MLNLLAQTGKAESAGSTGKAESAGSTGKAESAGQLLELKLGSLLHLLEFELKYLPLNLSSWMLDRHLHLKVLKQRG